ncbi:UvrD-helicase domain-containing protein [Clostridium sp. Cult3]|uniref:UvrD-helicase domain-containing protein n=1 Tax=Clostridium sp. Cult3 TaxID=2079004 RepID=UPI001F017BC8|nr:UvrD-helicase domain-containing protein [Clostridium sp. Cult3]MCF6461194.1 ATP-dependent DNA helicase PcrA [Clostridium sp. Cult3]
MDYIKGLNDRQKEAVLHTEGPLLILAGAGSGKTRVLTHRIAYLIEEKGVFPGNILAITFTNKAANEMKERVASLLDGDVDNIWMGTFHSIGVRILRRDINKIGYERNFSIYDRDDQITLMKECIKEKDLNKDIYKEKSVLGTISTLKDGMISPDTYINQNYNDFYRRNVGELYALYQKKLKQNNALDFDDLIIKTLELLRTDPMVLDYYQKKFKYIFIDEFQDTNKSQYELVRLLSNRYRNLCVVGDDDQCVLEGSKVSTPKGQISIEDLKEAGVIYSASGRGEVLEGGIDKIIKKEYKGPIINIKTKSGKSIRTTPNHIMFGKLNPEPGVFYVYLMYRRDKGYRIGVTQGVRTREKKIVNGLMVRLNQEQGDKAWIIKTCNSKSEAVFYQQLLSIEYQIPTTCFHVVGKEMSINQEYNDRIFEEIDTETNAIKLMEDFLLFEEYPHHRANCVIRGDSIRQIVNLSFFSGKKAGVESGWYSHRIHFNTSGDKSKKNVEASGFPVWDENRESWRVETERADYDEAIEFAKSLEGLDEEMEIVKRARLTDDNYFIYMPASHIRPNMSIPVYEDGNIVEDIVEATFIEEYKGNVYDISVPNLRQYICQDIVVHNSIYGWRGADITNILNFEKDFPNTKIIKLEQNYRSTKNILNVANHVIKNNSERKDKSLWTDNEEGNLVVVESLPDSQDEAYFVVNKVEELMNEGYKPADFAILYRTNAQSRSFEEAFMKRNIPYKIVGGLRFYDRKEIKDIIAYLKLIQNPVDDISLKRIINVPKRGIGNATVGKVEEYANAIGESIYIVLQDVESVPGLSTRAINSLSGFKEIINNLMDMKEEMGIKDFIEEVLYRTEYIKELEKEDNIEAQTRLENIREFISVAIDFEVKNPEGTLEDFLANVSLLSDVDKTEDVENSATMLTVHSAKGLEFPVVFMVGMEEGLFPISRALEDESELEEERRLCYVAITRAQELLFITHAKIRTIYGNVNYSLPSRFIDEIPEDLIFVAGHETSSVKSGRKQLINVIDYSNRRKVSTPEPKIDDQDIKVGTKVNHKKWGVGTIVQIKDRDNDKEVVIAFDNTIGLKRLLLSIAPIEIVKGD